MGANVGATGEATLSVIADRDVTDLLALRTKRLQRLGRRMDNAYARATPARAYE